MKILPFLVLVLVLPGPISILHLPELLARSEPPLPSPATISPALASMAAAFSPTAELESESENHHHHQKMDANNKFRIALVVSSSALGSIILSLTCLWICHRKKKMMMISSPLHKLQFPPSGKFKSLRISCNNNNGLAAAAAPTLMDYKVLEMATKGFHETNILGQGGFGCVYKARLDDNNTTVVAVKKLDGGSQDAITEFQTEVDLLSKIHHPNIIQLIGYSTHDETRLIVYELMQNGSLETQLHGTSHGSALSWPARMKIALDIARGLEYLHEHCNPSVIHRDLKSSNILLDSNFNAKISDFGLAVTDDKNSIKLSGTLGYLAPEYLLDGKLTDKSDVYAYGVVLLELLLGRRPVEKLAPAQCQSIITWAMPQLTDRSKLPNIVDPVIRNTMDLKHLYQVAAVAVLCVQPEPSYRPLIIDVLHSLIPLVPMELGGTLRAHLQPPFSVTTRHSAH